MDLSGSLPMPWLRSQPADLSPDNWPAPPDAPIQLDAPGPLTPAAALPAQPGQSPPRTERLVRAAHELKAPASAMLGLAELIATDSESPLAARHADYLKHLMSAGRHLVSMIDELMDLSLAQSGRLSINPGPVDLPALATEACGCAQPQARALGLHLTVRTAGQPVPVWADRRRSLQVLNNLLTNALRYNRPGGWVDVCVGPGPCIAVSDSGPGMDDAQLASLFEPFNRLGRDLLDARGAGVGLALSDDLMQLMDGNLLVSSTPGVGTSVTMTLPVARPTVAVPVEQPVAITVAAEPDDRCLLCIDDNPVNALLLQEYFQLRSGIRVRVAENACEGLALARAERPMAVLLDLWLPDMDGLEVLRQLRADPATQQIPVAIVSGCINADELQRARDLGAQACWPKPLDLSRLEPLLAELLKRPQPA